MNRENFDVSVIFGPVNDHKRTDINERPFCNGVGTYISLCEFLRTQKYSEHDFSSTQKMHASYELQLINLFGKLT